jgi:hypothetical protein
MMLTQQQVAELFEYRDGGLYYRVTRGGNVAGSRAGTLQQIGYRQVMVAKKKYYEHRVIYLLCHGVWPDEIDHINGVKFDNRIENLRSCGSSENKYNLCGRSATGVKGVYFDKRRDRYYVELTACGRRTRAGSFASLEEATSVVQNLRVAQHGVFANHG